MITAPAAPPRSTLPRRAAPRLRLLCALALLPALLLGPGDTAAQQDNAPLPGADRAAPPHAEEFGSAWSGIDGFVMLLQRSGARLVKPEEFNWDRPAKGALLILLGTPPRLPDLPRRLGEFSYANLGQGSVLVASDCPEMQPVFAAYGATLHPGPFVVGRPRDAYHGFADCPLVRIRSERRQPPMADGVERLALNRTGWLDPPKDHWAQWELPPDRSGDRNAFLLLHTLPRIVLLADHSPFINLMLTEESNLAFASNLLKLFAPRTVLLYMDGQAVHPEMFPPGFPELGQEASVRLVDAALRGIEEEGMLRRLPHRIQSAIAAVGVMLLACTLALWILRRPTAGPEVLVAAPALLTAFGAATTARPQDRDFRLPAAEFLAAWWRRCRARHDFPAEAGRTPGEYRISAEARGAVRRRLARDLATLASAGAQAPGSPLRLKAFRALLDAAQRCDAVAAGIRIEWVAAPGVAPAEAGGAGGPAGADARPGKETP